jgi:galactoside O-acetyltransferase
MPWNEDIKKTLGSCGSNVSIGFCTTFTNPSQVFLGDNVRIDPYCLITTGLTTGNNVQVMSHTVFSGGSAQKVILGNWSFVGYQSLLVCASEDYEGTYGPVNEYFFKGNKIFRGDIQFGDYSGVASQVMVMPGAILPEGCTVGAKSFVYSKDDLTSWSIFLGNPLKFHKPRNKYNVISLAEKKQ